MPPQIVGLSLAMAWFIIALAVLQMLAMGVRRFISPDADANTFFALAVAPAGGAVLFVVGLFVPAQWRFEVPQAAESLSISVQALALVAAASLATTLARAGRSIMSTRRLTRRWMRHAARLPAHRLPVPAFVVDDALPLAVLVGVTSPRIIISRRLLEHLTDVEVEAVLAHEAAHHASHDNLKRLMLAFFSIAWFMPQVDSWAARWAAKSERTADASAAAANAHRATALASALVKASRLMIHGHETSSMGSALHHGTPVAERVRRLLQPEMPPARTRSLRSLSTCVAASIGAMAVYPSALPIVHRATEWLLHGLP